MAMRSEEEIRSYLKMWAEDPGSVNGEYGAGFASGYAAGLAFTLTSDADKRLAAEAAANARKAAIASGWRP